VAPGQPEMLGLSHLRIATANDDDMDPSEPRWRALKANTTKPSALAIMIITQPFEEYDRS
jgi:hypothetical protein